MKKDVFENFEKFIGKQLWFEKFSRTLFYRIPLDDCFWLFPETFLRCATANSVWKTSEEYSLFNKFAILKLRINEIKQLLILFIYSIILFILLFIYNSFHNI